MKPEDFPSRTAGKVIFNPLGFWVFIPNPLPPKINWSTSLVSGLAEAERDLSQLATQVRSFPFPRLLVQLFVRHEAVISSRIEGTRASLVDLYAYETTQLSFFAGSRDVREVFNYVRAMDYGFERLKTFPMSLRLIRELHARLMEAVRGERLTPGEFRRSQNWIGPLGSTPDSAPYVPPPVEEMHQALDALEKFIHRETELPPLIRCALIHYQFEAIHPFLDGNGRVGRLLIPLLLAEWDLLPQPMLNLSIYFERYRQQYYDLLLSVSQSGAWEDWLRFFLRGISTQALESVARLERLLVIRYQYQAFIDQQRNPLRMSGMVDYLFMRPILSVGQVAAELGINYKTANDYMKKLEKIGVVREITGYGRKRIFQADEILQAVQGNW